MFNLIGVIKVRVRVEVRVKVMIDAVFGIRDWVAIGDLILEYLIVLSEAPQLLLQRNHLTSQSRLT